ncbi:MAG: (d)CMP kinase [Actinobacteria bacterium]|nr:(d)CMP kinase [Actinomycetota bacterium]
MFNFPEYEVEPIVSAIAEISARKEGPILIAIDGPAGSGKTSLANQLSNKLNSVTTIHMDDLYNGWEDALTATLTKHLEEWIIYPLKKHQGVEYQKFNWTSNEYGPSVEVRDIEILILEGVGAAQTMIRQQADLSIWIEVGPQIGLARVLNRDGAQILPYMLKWQERESVHFLKDQTKENCQIFIDGGNNQIM